MDIGLGSRQSAGAYGAAGSGGWGTGEGATYTVQRGDTLTRIARMHGVSLADLIAANPQIRNPNLIYPEQRVNIPGAGGAAASSAVAGADAGAVTDGPLSREQLAQVFHQAGFRGEALVSMVAIAMRESGGDPDAFNGDAGTGDLSYGLVQINMLGRLGEARREQLGLESNDQLFDPLTNARAAYAISNQGRDLSPWGGYKGLSNTYNTDMTAAREAVRNAEREGLLGQPFTGGAPAAAGGGAGVAPSGSAAAPGSIQAAIDFGMGHLGAPYVGGASPFRFGDRPGDGRTFQMDGQKAYVSPRGEIGFDCSGFIVAMYRHIGVDLGHIASSRAMKSQLPAISPEELRPGDLLVKNGHVVMVIGNGKVLESSPAQGVRVNDASRFLSDPAYVCRRVPMG